MTEDPTFDPRDGSPTIHVNIRTTNTEDREKEIQRMTEKLHGETVYNLAPVTTTEYDVVACADFVEDKGCWIRNMPQEIRDSNPDFVPS
jgi:hypothetical protein